MTDNRKRDNDKTKTKTEIRKTTGAGTRHERQNAQPSGDAMTSPREVWKESETTPSPEEGKELKQGVRGRVADAGDLGGGTPAPYGTEAQADAAAKQTDPKKKTYVEKPKKK